MSEPDDDLKQEIDEALLDALQPADLQTERREAIWLWEKGLIDWLIVGKGDFEKLREKLSNFEIVAETPTLPEKADEYRLVRRLENQHLPGVSIPNPSSSRSRDFEKANIGPDWGPPSKLH